MDDGPQAIEADPFRITREQLKELVEIINCAVRERRKEVALERNGNPFEDEQVRREHWALVLDGHTAPNGSIYIENKYIDIVSAEEYINSCLTALRGIRSNSEKFRIAPLPQGFASSRNTASDVLEVGSRIFDVRHFDDIVKLNLEQCYRALTGEQPNMGGYKPTKGLGEQLLPARLCESPFTQFALFLLELIDLRRLNGKKYTLNILRNSASGTSSAAARSELIEEPASIKQLKRKPKGRPSSEHDPRKLRDETPVEVEECSDREAQLIIFKDRRNSKLARRRRKQSARNPLDPPS
jgi:hypothetical protein